jgi:hypothetical protein
MKISTAHPPRCYQRCVHCNRHATIALLFGQPRMQGLLQGGLSCFYIIGCVAAQSSSLHKLLQVQAYPLGHVSCQGVWHTARVLGTAQRVAGTL